METWEQLVAAVLSILPNATFSEDDDGQIIINTNKQMVNSLTGEETTDIVEMDVP